MNKNFEERKYLSNLKSNAQKETSPYYLKSKIILKMKEENLIRAYTPLVYKSVGGISLAVLLLVGAIAIGFIIGKKSHPIQSSASTSINDHQYILFVKNDDVPPPDPMQQVREYGNWLKKIKAERIADGEHLFANGWLLSSIADKNVQVQPFEQLPGSEQVGGYFTFNAHSESDAIAIARSCPHLNYHGTLELREIHTNE